MNTEDTNERVEQEAKWRPLDMRQRRVLGVLVEKAKTTPDAYPMTLNAITTACNQKSNRSPQMTLHSDDVELTLDELREMGAVVEVHGGGRAAKYKHLMYEWLDVDRFEIAVMAELLLRGEQTLGELRGRASRMESIADLDALRPVIDSLLSKNLMLEITPQGRGQIVTHNLYQEPELKRIREQAGRDAPTASSGPPADVSSPTRVSPSELETLQKAVGDLQQEVAQLRARLDQIEADGV